MEDLEQSSLEEKVDLGNIVLFPKCLTKGTEEENFRIKDEPSEIETNDDISENNNIKLIPHIIEFKRVGLDKILWYSTNELKKKKKEYIRKLFEFINLENNSNI